MFHLHKTPRFVLAPALDTHKRAAMLIGSEDDSVGDEDEETMRTVGKEILVDEGLQQGSGETQCQNKKNIRQNKEEETPEGTNECEKRKMESEKR